MKDHTDGVLVIAHVPHTIDDLWDELAIVKELTAGNKVATDALRTAVARIAPRLEVVAGETGALAARIDALTVEFRGLGEKVHRANNLLPAFADELQELHQARLLFARSIDTLEARVLMIRAEATSKEGTP